MEPLIIEGIRAAINEKTRLVEIERSKGYLTRPTFSVEQIGELISFIKGIKPDVICMVDNCYGEFVERLEPSDVGADLVVGSLIKNTGRRSGSYRRLYSGKRRNLWKTPPMSDLPRPWERVAVLLSG